MVKANFAQYDTAANNTDVGGVAIAAGSPISSGDDALREIMSHIKEHFSEGSIASATTTDIGAENPLMLNVTGTTTITGLGTIDAGTEKVLIFADALTFTHNATSLILPGGANITTAAGDVAWMISEGAGNWRCLMYMAADGTVPGLQIGTDVQAYDADTLKADTADTLTAGFRDAADDDGTQSSGTYTPSDSAGTWSKQITNGGSFTLAPPSPANDEVIYGTILMINNASAGAVTVSGWTNTGGASLTTTDTHKFIGSFIVYDDGGTEYSYLSWSALQ